MQQSLGRLLAILYRKKQMYINTHLKELGITSGEVGFLMSLYREEGQTQEALCCALHIDKAAATRALGMLQKKGYVTKKQDRQDRRCNRIFLTNRARENQAQVIEVMRHWSEVIAQNLGEPQYQALCSALESINELKQKEWQ
ncbi:MAG: MarR family transcriptional regulator [Spirochaetia bacterium]|nr:MarR family transcriptional regulator [Spirochaetia bacterium]